MKKRLKLYTMIMFVCIPCMPEKTYC